MTWEERGLIYHRGLIYFACEKEKGLQGLQLGKLSQNGTTITSPTSRNPICPPPPPSRAMFGLLNA